MERLLTLKSILIFKMAIKPFFSSLFAKYINYKNLGWINNPIRNQKKIFSFLIKNGTKTEFGRKHNFKKIKNYEDWKRAVPIRDYEGLKPYVEKIISGKKNILWPKETIYFCKTSGTTSGVKYIPLTKSSLSNQIRAARDSILAYLLKSKKFNLVSGKMIFIQGSPVLSRTGGVLTGRLSGIVAHHIPSYLTKNRLPSFKTNSIENWEDKLDAIVKETTNENMTIIGGIPPWVQMYFEKLINYNDKNIISIFKNFSLFIYGGVNFEPYRETFKNLIGKQVDGIEVYPASEGFIAYQNDYKEKGLLLCVNHGVFYEFISADEFYNESPCRISLEDVKLNINYVIILNTDAGLWGYNIGDTIRFISLNPYKIVVTGRIKHFTSAFGEHVISEEVDSALLNTIKTIPAEIVEFHVAPEVSPSSGLPYHEWFIEFSAPPKNLSFFEKTLDRRLQDLNTYYKDLVTGGVLSQLKITIVKKDGFRNYMSSIGKLGGQNKVPRLANNRKIAEKLIAFI